MQFLIDRCPEAQIEDVVREGYGIERMLDGVEQIIRALGADRLVIDPVTAQIVVGIAGAHRFMHFPGALGCQFAFIGRMPDREMLEHIDQIFEDRALEEMCIGPRIGDAPPGDRFRQRQQVRPLTAMRPFSGHTRRAMASAKASVPPPAVPMTADGFAGPDVYRDIFGGVWRHCRRWRRN